MEIEIGHDLATRDPQTLARLFDVDDKPLQSPWAAGELEQVLRHQLSAPLLFDLTGMQTKHSRMPTQRGGRNQPASFGELFNNPNPPLEMLKLVKEFAKTSDQRASSPLPAEISTVLYYAAILSARLRLNERISRLSDEALAKGIRWALGQNWIEPLKELFLAGHNFLEIREIKKQEL